MAWDLLLIGVLTALWAWLTAHSEGTERPGTPRAPAGDHAGQRPATGDRPNDGDEPRPVA